MNKSDKKIRVMFFSNVFRVVNDKRIIDCVYKTIDNKLEDMQQLVGGLIDRISITTFNKNGVNYSIDLVFNDEGKINFLPVSAIVIDKYNFGDYICGSSFLALANEDTGEYIDLPQVYYNSIMEKLLFYPHKLFDNFYQLPFIDCSLFNEIDFKLLVE